MSTRTLKAFTTIDLAPGLTQLFPLTDFGTNFSSLLFAVVNLDSVSSCQWFIDTSQDGLHIEISDRTLDRNNPVTILANTQSSFEIGPYILRRYFSMSVMCASPVQIKYAVWGADRL